MAYDFEGVDVATDLNFPDLGVEILSTTEEFYELYIGACCALKGIELGALNSGKGGGILAPGRHVVCKAIKDGSVDEMSDAGFRRIVLCSICI